MNEFILPSPGKETKKKTEKRKFVHVPTLNNARVYKMYNKKVVLKVILWA